MKMYSYKVNKFCSFVSMFGAIVSALTHQLGFLLINFFFAVWNWYIAEWKRGLENESKKESDDTEDEE